MVRLFALSLYAALAQRALLLANHVLTAEPVAAQLLRAHAGSCILLHFAQEGGAWLSALPAVRLTITRAGLLERKVDPITLAAPDLRIDVDATNPALVTTQWLAGVPPKIEVQGDANLAADLAWVVENLRWDVQDDLARIVGVAGAHEIARFGSALTTGLQRAAGALVDRVARKPPAGAAAPAPR